MSWFPKTCVVVPVDFSAASDHAVQTALEVTRSSDQVHILHVTQLPEYTVYGEFPQAVDSAMWLQHAEQHMAKYISEKKLTGVTTKVVLGDPGLQIAEYARELKADLIVIPSHGYHGFKRILLGSVTERVLRHAPCEVLVLRRPE